MSSKEEKKEKITSKQMLEKIKQNKATVTMVNGKPTTMNMENLQRFVMGELTWAQVQGLSMQQVYALAESGYKLFEQGKYKDAEDIFRGLVVMNPYDGYFHSVLGSIYARQGLDDMAALEYTFAINSAVPMVEAYVNRAEVFLRNGQFELAMNDLKKATELDPNNDNPATLRARALAGATANMLNEILQKKKDESHGKY